MTRRSFRPATLSSRGGATPLGHGGQVFQEFLPLRFRQYREHLGLQDHREGPRRLIPAFAAGPELDPMRAPVPFVRPAFNQPEETARAMRRGWLLTGDIGHRDADGFFYITDRKKDMLLVNGMNVYPREIEEILYQFPGVKEAAVIGVADQRKGEPTAAAAGDRANPGAARRRWVLVRAQLI